MKNIYKNINRTTFILLLYVGLLFALLFVQAINLVVICDLRDRIDRIEQKMVPPPRI